MHLHLSLPKQIKCPSTTSILVAVRLQVHADGVQIYAENFCTPQAMNFGDFFLFVLPNSSETCQKYEVVQKEFFLACFPQGNAGCQAKSINSHAKMIKRIVLACCAWVRKCLIYSYFLAFISALLLFWPVQYMTWESFRRSCTYSHIINLVYFSLE